MDRQQGPALPWANEQANEQQAEDERPEPDLPSTMGLRLGDRIEVLWEVVEDDGNGQTKTKWWGAKLHQRLDEQTDGEGRAVYVLRYDPDVDNGFTEHEECSVTFLEEHYLYDLGQDDELPWRREGEEWEAPAGADGGDGMVIGGEVFTLGDIAADIKKSERRRGRTLEQDTAEVLGQFPQEQRIAIAAGFRSFAETLAAHINTITEQKGADYVVTAADVQAATAAARAAMQHGGGM